MAELRKEVKQERIWGYISFIALLLFGIYQSVFSFETIVGGLIYFGIFLLIQIPIWKLFFSFKRETPLQKVLNTCDRLSITVIAFAEKLEEGTINIYGESIEDDMSNFYQGEWENPAIIQEEPEAKV